MTFSLKVKWNVRKKRAPRNSICQLTSLARNRQLMLARYIVKALKPMKQKVHYRSTHLATSQPWQFRALTFQRSNHLCP